MPRNTASQSDRPRVPCRVCTRPLRAPYSVMAGVGPVCLKRQRSSARALLTTLYRSGEAENLIRSGRISSGDVNALQDRAALQSAERFGAVATSEDRQLFSALYGMSHQEMSLLSDEMVRTVYRERRRQVRPSESPVDVMLASETRGGEENVSVQWVTEHAAITSSQGGGNYVVTHETCTCPQFLYRVRLHPELYPSGCRHMQALQSARQMVEASRSASARQQAVAWLETHPETAPPSAEPVLPAPTAEPVPITPPRGAPIIPPEPTRPSQVQNTLRIRPQFASAQMTDDAMREEILNTWRETRAFDGLWMQEDEAAFARLMEQATADWELVTDGSVLGGTGNTFGVELEMKFRSGDAMRRAVLEMYQDGLTNHREQQRYHEPGSGGMWVPTRDRSLGSYGLEMVSPVLQDRPEDWEGLQHILDVAKRHGAYVDAGCGTHTNIGAGPLDSRTFNWQRLARVGVAHERTLYRMGGADSEQFRQTGEPGRHRGTFYVNPFDRVVKIGDRTSPIVARNRLGGDHTKIFNCTHDNRIEMRYPNGTLDLQQIQANVIVNNAMVHQAAAIKKRMPQDRTTPKLSDAAQHDRLHRPYGSPAVALNEEQAFKRFLDFLGTSIDRKAAAWLWKRGRALQ